MRRRIPGVRFDDEIKDAEADIEKAVEVLGGEGARVERPLTIQSGLPEAKAHDRVAPHVGRRGRLSQLPESRPCRPSGWR